MDGSGEARRGVRRDPEPPAGPVIRNTRPLTYPARLTLPHNQGRKVDGPSPVIYPQSVAMTRGLRLAFSAG